MKILPYLIVTLALIALILFAADQVNQSAAQRLAAEAIVIRAQSQARLDATSANLPYVAIAVSAIFGSAIIGLGAVIYKASDQPVQPQQIIERHVIVMITPPGPRREAWKRISAMAKDDFYLL